MKLPLSDVRPRFVAVLLWSLLFLTKGPLELAAKELSIPDQSPLPAQATVGAGSSSFEIAHSEVRLHAVATAFGQYTENWYRKAAVVDYLLPQAIPLPEGTERLALEYENSYETNKGAELDLRVLITDSRGGTWAVGTRLGARLSRLNFTLGPVALETYAFDTAEIGRQDPWVAMSLDPKKFDTYTLPQPPYKFSGFRLVVGGALKTPVTLAIRSLESLPAGEQPDRYWLLTGEYSWSQRTGKSDMRYGHYGWGPVNPEPLLQTADLKISPGKYNYSWEILRLNDWDVVCSDYGNRTVESAGDTFLRFPLLPAGTYHLRLAAKREGENAFKEFFLTYVVIRNHTIPENSAAALEQKKPLQLAGNGPVIKGGATIRVACRPDACPGGTIAWTVETSDGRMLANGETAADQPTSISLGERAREESVFWITARLMNGGEVRDIVRRTVGFASGPVSKAPSGKAGGKLDSLGKELLRVKGDWSEGAEPVVTKFSRSFEQLLPWLDEAREIGYNCVELPATWCEFNPLPGVYQFHYLDRMVDEAQKRGLKVTLRVHPDFGLVPGWVPRELQQNQDGMVHGLWAGSNDLIFSPSSAALRGALSGYLAALAAHYRDSGTVIGYCLSSLHFDHDLLDAPWLGQSVDYSETARRAFVEFLRRQSANDLSRLNRRLQTSYKDWNDVSLPLDKPVFSSSGMLQPRIDPLWTAWTEFKVASIRDFRLGGVQALREGDPRCWVGLYNSDTSKLYLNEIAEKSLWVTFGSMESQLPFGHLEVRGRFEPHAKIARTAALVDVGMSNLVMSDAPGRHGFFNYWMFPWRLSGIKPAELEAELRLKQWFGVVDRLIGARFSANSHSASGGAYVASFSTQLLALQNTFMGRFEDYLKPFTHRLGIDKVSMEEVLVRSGAVSLSSHAYLYVPYATSVVSPALRDALRCYVEAGGKLVLEANSGYWLETDNHANALGGVFGLPPVEPTGAKASPASEPVIWSKDASFAGVPLAFRTQSYEPPINNQPTPWIQNIPRAFLQPYRAKGTPPPDAAVWASYADGKPAVLRFPCGNGEVLLFCGIIDWLASPGLSRAMDEWGHSQPIRSASVPDPALLARELVKGQTRYLIGRRFINQDLIESLKQGQGMELLIPQSLPVAFSSCPEGKRYQVKELLSNTDLGWIEGKNLNHTGVFLSLTPGQAFLLEAVPQK